MSRSFNIGGPCTEGVHYMLDPIARLPKLEGLISSHSYFVMHAPRQTGKTTSLMAYARRLTEEGQYAAVLLSMQRAAEIVDGPGPALRAVLAVWRAAAQQQLPQELWPPDWPEGSAESLIGSALAAWSLASPRPLVVFLDEIDALEGSLLRSVLHQLRSSHPLRPRGFPQSLALVGLRDLQDYKYGAGSEHPPRSAPSPFNIIVDSLTLQNFSREDIAALYQQHTTDTGQPFDADAIEVVWELTAGQPWLVNALARLMVQVLEPVSTRALTRAHVLRARELLLERRDTHLRVLADRLTDPRVRSILEPVLTGQPPMHFEEDDLRLTFDLGLLRRGEGGALEISNPIYHATLLDALMRRPREAIPYLTSPVWMKDGKLDLERLLEVFVEFWRQHGSALLATVDYPELAPQLVVLAFMQRVVNGGGKVSREEPVERGRMDLFVQHGEVKLAIELKVWRPHQKDPLEEGLAQLEGYMRHLDTKAGWLFIFDRRVGQPQLIDRLHATQATTPAGLDVTVLRS